MIEEEDMRIIEKKIADAVSKSNIIHQSQIPPGIIKRRHIEDKIITFGLAAERPTDNTTGIFCWFSTDTDVLSCYNGNAWVGTTLS